MGTIIAGDEQRPPRWGGFLIALRLKLKAKARTADEIAAPPKPMRAHVIEVRPGTRVDLVDTAGTGGPDWRQHVHISTAGRSLVGLQRAGARRREAPATARFSSASGSADVLEELGFRLELSAGTDRAVHRRGSASASWFAPAAPSGDCGTQGPVRRELAARTVFNVLGAADDTQRATRAQDRGRLLHRPSCR